MAAFLHGMADLQQFFKDTAREFDNFCEKNGDLAISENVWGTFSMDIPIDAEDIWGCFSEDLCVMVQDDVVNSLLLSMIRTLILNFRAAIIPKTWFSSTWKGYQTMSVSIFLNNIVSYLYPLIDGRSFCNWDHSKSQAYRFELKETERPIGRTAIASDNPEWNQSYKYVCLL